MLNLASFSIQAGKGMLEEASPHFNSPTREEKLYPVTSQGWAEISPGL